MYGKENIVYLDNNATTKVDEKVLEAMLPYFCEDYANPGGMYDFAAKLKKPLQNATESVKELFGAERAKDIYFTASGSEGANMAIRGIASSTPLKKHFITTKVEHPCVLNTHKILEKKGHKVTYLGVNSEGQIDFNELEEAVQPDTALVSVMIANNETGVVFPVEKIAETVKKINPDTKIFVDAVQGAGKIKLDVKNSLIDMMSVSGHKFHAPKGVGAIYVKPGTPIVPLITGGHQERGKRAGTENVPGIIGMGVAAGLAVDFLNYECNEIKRLRDKLERNILKNIFNSRLNSSVYGRVPNTCNIGFEYIEGELILLHLNDAGICASSGSACTSGSLDASHVLKAMGVPFTALHGSVRFSLSRYTKEDEIDYVCKVLPGIIEKISAISPFQKELSELKALKHGQ